MNQRLPALIFRLRPRASGAIVFGRTMPREDTKEFVPFILNSAAESVVLLDYSSIVAATSSYLERTYVWAMNCGRLAAGVDARDLSTLDDPEDAISPLEIYPIAVGCTPEVINEIVAVSRKTRSIFLVASDRERFLSARLIGELDRALRETLDLLIAIPSASAADLHEHTNRKGVSGTRGIQVNVWNNRLAELHKLRLARREKEGRLWRYTSILEAVAYG